MAASAPALSARMSLTEWLTEFLKDELLPYPERGIIVARMVIASVIAMLVVMTLRIPGASLAPFFALTLSRESPRATLNSGIATVLGYIAGLSVALAGAPLFSDTPLLHFLWLAGSMFIVFFVLRTGVSYVGAISFSFMMITSIIAWDQPFPADLRVRTTLWALAAVGTGTLVTVVVEAVSASIHPVDMLTAGLNDRLHTVERVLASYLEPSEDGVRAQEKISQLAIVGIGRLRKNLRRSEFGSVADEQYESQMSTVLALVGRIVDIASNLAHLPLHPTERDRERMRAIIAASQAMRERISAGGYPEPIKFAHADEISAGVPVLPEIEKTLTLIPLAFTEAELPELVQVPDDPASHTRILVHDAFSNPEYIRYALRGALAGTLCWIIYNAIGWHGLNTSVATCIVTALSNVGSSRQKQLLRVSGAIIGGLIFGMGAQIFLFPYMDSIIEFGLYFAAVSTIAAWVSTSSPRLSYLGLQIALAFYLVTIQDFRAPLSLSVARDRVVGIMLGLVIMWLVYDRTGTRSSSEDMRRAFADNLRLLSKLALVLNEPDRSRCILKIRSLRDRISSGFSSVQTHADSISFEFGRDRVEGMELRDRLLPMQTSLETFYLTQLALIHYRLRLPLDAFPEMPRRAHLAFREGVAKLLNSMANSVESGAPFDTSVDLNALLANFDREVQHYYALSSDESGLSASAYGILKLVRQLTTTAQALSRQLQPAT